MTAPFSPHAFYEQRVAHFAAARAAAARRSDRQANISLALAGLALLVFTVALWQQSSALLWATALPAAAFVASFIRHGRINRERDHAAARLAINQEGLHRLRRDWDALPLPGSAPVAGPARALATDLDLLGRASLQQLLGTAATPVGQHTLQSWLLQPAPPDVLARRQEAVRDLAARVELRDALAAQGRAMQGAQGHYEQLIAWAESTPWLTRRRWLLPLAWLVPLLVVLGFVANGLGLTSLPLWLLGPIIGVLVMSTVGGAAGAIINQVAERQNVFGSYAELFRLFADEAVAAPELQRLQATLTANGLRADAQMRRLARLMPFADVRGWIFFPLIQFATLWDIHLLWQLERWQQVAGTHARAWLNALGDLEALAALATLAHDHPDWTFPETNSEPVLAAQAIGHPLLPPEQCVRNDVALGPPGTFLLITGSNMSGKSTLLRAIGTNVVLAQAGGPVCAARLQLPPLTLATSIRVQDSLEAGVSYFMAELQRLKMVVDIAEQARGGERLVLFLLDEILHGTNTDERQVAARRIIGYLLKLGATGAVSTHDLTLADTPDLAAQRTTGHFTETLSRDHGVPRLDFDYQLRPGLATSTNALALVEIVGLPGAEQ